MKKGFTLAEVLITLAIIGVVAALTIPVVVHKYQQKQFYTAFMKSYNTLTNAFDMSVADNGEPNAWSYNNSENEYFQKYLGDYLKVAAVCKGNPSACGASAGLKGGLLNIKSSDILSDLEEAGFNDYYAGINREYSLLLQDGSLLMISFAGDYSRPDEIDITLDTNGVKGPNIMGRDMHIFEIRGVSGTYSIAPFGVIEGFTLSNLTSGEDMDENCSTSTESVGLACGARMLLEGKMNY